MSFVTRSSATPEHVLIVDDVITSGATLGAAAIALRNASSSSVIGVSAGRTPLKVVKPRADAQVVVTRREAIVSSLPPGLLDDLRAGADAPVVRPTELARVRHRMATVSVDSPAVIEGIASGLLDTASTADVASV